MTANVSSIPPASPSPLPPRAVVADDFEAVNRTIVTQLNSRVPLVETIGQYIIEAAVNACARYWYCWQRARWATRATSILPSPR